MPQEPQPGNPIRWRADQPDETGGTLRPVTIAPIDGNFRRDMAGDRPCLRTDRASGNGYVYFDIARRWLRAHGAPPYRVEARITYLDDIHDTVSVQFDSAGNTVDDNFRTITWNRAGTGNWATKTIVLESAELANSQHGRADLRIAAGAKSDIAIAEIQLTVLSASARAPEPVPPPPATIPAPSEMGVTFGTFSLEMLPGASESVRMAAERWASRAKSVGAGKSSPHLTVVAGVWNDTLRQRYPKTAALMERATRLPSGFQRCDTAVVCLERGGKNPIVCAFGLEAPGAVNALSTLLRQTLATAAGPAVFVSKNPSPDTPAFDRREIYVNIGYGLRRPGITVEDWTLDRWKQAIDHWIASGLNTWSFYLWGDGQTLHPVSANRDLNQRLHRTLRSAIDYSHRRGMRVGMHFTPSMVPVALWKSRPDLQAKLEYDYPGTVCTSHPDSRRWMEEVHAPELRWFHNVDFFSLWFYDVGGCFCPRCRPESSQLAALDWQTRTFRKIAADSNPAAEFQVMGWAIWRYEQKHGWALRTKFLEQSSRSIPKAKLLFADGLQVDPGATTLLADFDRVGAQTAGFLYQTNIETGQPFPLVLSRLLSREIRAAQRQGIDHAFFMRMETGSKTVDDSIAARFLWNPSTAAGAALLDSARLATGGEQSARHLAEALALIDDFSWFGYGSRQASPARGREIQAASKAAVCSAPVAMRTRLEWLDATGDAFRILGDAVAAHADEDPRRVAELEREFAARMRASPLFRHQADGAPYWKNLFRDVLCRHFHAGFAAGAF